MADALERAISRFRRSPQRNGTSPRHYLPISRSRSRGPASRPYQEEAAQAILQSVWNGRGLTFTVVMARQAGKNELSAEVELLLLARNHRRDVSGVRCAPTLEPQARISFARLWNRILRAGAVEMAAREDGRVIRFGRSRQIFLSAEPTANGMGHTAGLLLEVDEAQDVDREKFDREFRPMAAPAGATTIYYGTPLSRRTWNSRVGTASGVTSPPTGRRSPSSTLSTPATSRASERASARTIRSSGRSTRLRRCPVAAGCSAGRSKRRSRERTRDSIRRGPAKCTWRGWMSAGRSGAAEMRSGKWEMRRGAPVMMRRS